MDRAADGRAEDGTYAAVPQPVPAPPLADEVAAAAVPGALGVATFGTGGADAAPAVGPPQTAATVTAAAAAVVAAAAAASTAGASSSGYAVTGEPDLAPFQRPTSVAGTEVDSEGSDVGAETREEEAAQAPRVPGIQLPAARVFHLGTPPGMSPGPSAAAPAAPVSAGTTVLDSAAVINALLATITTLQADVQAMHAKLESLQASVAAPTAFRNKDMPQMNRKDVDKPSKYNGTKWPT